MEITGMVIVKWVLLALLGALIHYLKKIIEERRAGSSISLGSYWLDHPYEVALSLAGTAGFLWIGVAMGEMTDLTAIAAGYAGDSFSGVVGKRAISLNIAK